MSGSLSRCRCVREFLLLRLLRIPPALILVICFCALALGLLLTSFSLCEYLRNPKLLAYFQNILARLTSIFPISMRPRPGMVKGSLWTIHLELDCFISLALIAVFVWVAPGDTNASRRDIGPAISPGPNLAMGPCFCPCKAMAMPIPCRVAAGVCGDIRGFRRSPCWLTHYSYGSYLVGYPSEQRWMHFFPHVGFWWADPLLSLPLTMPSAFLLRHGIEQPTLRRKHQMIANFPKARAYTGQCQPVMANE